MEPAETPIEAVSSAVYAVPTDSPESDGTLAWDSTTMIVVTAYAAGVAGLGWTYGSPAVSPVIADYLAPEVISGDAMDVPGAADRMGRAVRNVGREGIAAMAISVVDIAPWDLKARRLDVPLAVLVGQVRGEVPIYGSGGFISYDDAQTRDQLVGWVRDSLIPRVKIKIGEGWGANERRDRARVALARDCIGPDAELYVDTNGAWASADPVTAARSSPWPSAVPPARPA